MDKNLEILKSRNLDDNENIEAAERKDFFIETDFLTTLIK